MRSCCSILLLSSLSFSALSFAQSGSKQFPTEAQKSFDTMKAFAGTWQGLVTTVPKMPAMGDNARVEVTLRITSRGNALVHEMKAAGAADDPTREDHPVTMFYLDSDRLLLTHYCDAGNRPRMEGKISPDGKTLDFTFLDVAGSTQYGHMQHAAFTTLDGNHHAEDWTFLMPGDKTVRAHLELQRVQ